MELSATPATGAINFARAPVTIKLSQQRPKVSDVPGVRFGYAMAIGDFNGDGQVDLAVGAPRQPKGKKKALGRVVIYSGLKGSGIRSSRFTNIHRSQLGGVMSSDEEFGRALAAGDFNGDGYDDLAIASPYALDAFRKRAGVVHVIYGGRRGLDTNQRTLLAQSMIPGAPPKKNDQMGLTLVAGDLNGDGKSDLAVGMPYKDVNGQKDAGAVAIFPGRSSGLGEGLKRVITQESVDSAKSEAGDHFGWSLAVGNFNDDRFEDLAIGTPHENSGGKQNTGMVTVIPGWNRLLKTSESQSFTQKNIHGASRESGDGFGFALAAGNFDGKPGDDLAIGSPDEDSAGTENTGLISMVPGGASGLSLAKSESFRQNRAHAKDKTNSQAGRTLTAADLDGDGIDDLLVGAASRPVEWLRTRDHMPRGPVGAGAVLVFFGTGEGFLPERSNWFSQDHFGQSNEADDRFGFSLAAGDFDGDGRAEAVFGLPFEDISTAKDAGMVLVSHIEAALPPIHARGAIVVDRKTGKVLGSKRADTILPMASTTKIMTALLTLEAIDAGRIRLDDRVKISKPAALVSQGAETYGINQGSRKTVDFLLRALMIRSVNAAGYALGEHVARRTPVTPSAIAMPPGASASVKSLYWNGIFTQLMNQRAKALGMKATHYVNAHGRDPEDNADLDGDLIGTCKGNDFKKPTCKHFTTARDLARLAAYALNRVNSNGAKDFEILVSTSELELPPPPPPPPPPPGKKAAPPPPPSSTSPILNTNKFVRPTSSQYDRRVYGVKTGTTHRAGPCLVTAARVEGGRDLVMVVLGSTESWYQSRGAEKYFRAKECDPESSSICENGTVTSHSHVCECKREASWCAEKKSGFVCKLWSGVAMDTRFDDTETIMDWGFARPRFSVVVPGTKKARKRPMKKVSKP